MYCLLSEVQTSELGLYSLISPSLRLAQDSSFVPLPCLWDIPWSDPDDLSVPNTRPIYIYISIYIFYLHVVVKCSSSILSLSLRLIWSRRVFHFPSR